MNVRELEQALMDAVRNSIFAGDDSKPEKVQGIIGTKLFVGNLSRQITQVQLTDLFSQAGDVAGAEVVMDKVSGVSRGFAIITMTVQSEATRAITMFNNFAWDKRILEVSLAE